MFIYLFFGGGIVCDIFYIEMALLKKKVKIIIKIACDKNIYIYIRAQTHSLTIQVE